MVLLLVIKVVYLGSYELEFGDNLYLLDAHETLFHDYIASHFCKKVHHDDGDRCFVLYLDGEIHLSSFRAIY
jgi:hypothetical protein